MANSEFLQYFAHEKFARGVGAAFDGLISAATSTGEEEMEESLAFDRQCINVVFSFQLPVAIGLRCRS